MVLISYRKATEMKRPLTSIFFIIGLFGISLAIAGKVPNTISISFGNEQHPTANAGIGPGMDVAREGEHLYLLQEHTLVVLSIADPAHPTLVGKLENLGNLRQIVVRGNIAYITAREDGLLVVDVSDPSTPQLRSHYDTIEFATGIDVKGHYAFVAQRWFGVEIIDVSNPSKLRHVSVVRVGEAQSCVVYAGYLYVGAWAECRIMICDVRNPADPKSVAELRLNGRGDGLCVENGILYAAYGHHQPGATTAQDDPRYGTGNGMDLFDVSDPTQPKQLSRVQFAWRYYYGWPDTWRVKLSFPYAYLYHTHNGVFILDVSDPKQPKELAQIRIPCFPNEKGYRTLSTVDHSGTRPVALPFDPEKVCYSPVCGLEAVDGYLYFTGLFTDLHLYKSDRLAHAIQPAKDTVPLTAIGHFHTFKTREPLDVKTVAIYQPEGQVYAAVATNGYVYAACGSAGIHVLNTNLTLLNRYSTAGFAMDIQLCGEKLYVAQGADGLVCYRAKGVQLEQAGVYKTSQSIRQVRVAPNDRYAVVHVGGNSYEILDVSSLDAFKRIKIERGSGGLVYYRQLCNGYIEDRYICGTWCGGRTFMIDLGGAAPVDLPDPKGFLPDMNAGGYCACGEYALLTRKGGYSVYKPQRTGTSDSELPVYRLSDGSEFNGKPAVRGTVLVACDRVKGDITVLDIKDLRAPRLIRRFKLSGNPDLPFIGDDFVLIPAGYQGLFRIPL